MPQPFGPKARALCKLAADFETEDIRVEVVWPDAFQPPGYPQQRPVHECYGSRVGVQRQRSTNCARNMTGSRQARPVLPWALKGRNMQHRGCRHKRDLLNLVPMHLQYRRAII